MRRYYLCPIIGTGKISTVVDAELNDAFRPKVTEYTDSWGMIDLRPDSTKTDGFAFAFADTDVPIRDREIKLIAESPIGRILLPTKSKLELTFRVSLEHNTLSSIVAELLIGKRRANLCKPLRPGKDGKYRIYLGELIYGVPEPRYRTGSITESFTGDGDVLGSDLSWTEVAGDWDRVSGEAKNMTVDQLCDARCESALSTDDQYAQINVTNLGSGGKKGWLGPCVRFQSDAETCYTTFPYDYKSKQYLRKIVTGNETDLASAVSITISLPELYKVTADGSSIKGYQAGTERISATDTDITGNLYTGIAGYWSGSGYCVGDDFEADDLVVAGNPWWLYAMQRRQ